MKKGKILIFVLGLLMGGCLFYTEHSKAAVLTVKHSYKNIYTQKYQKQVDAQLAKWKATPRTVDNPLFVRNPYGTMTTSLYY